MRQIKFRAWDKTSKEMIYIFNNNCFGYINDNGGLHFTTLIEKKDIDGNSYPEEVELDIELMQFTGLLDKNGKEIYEGDIVISEALIGNWLVYWDENDCGFFLIDNEGYTTVLCNEEIEIIGNRYENPELLETK